MINLPAPSVSQAGRKPTRSDPSDDTYRNVIPEEAPGVEDIRPITNKQHPFDPPVTPALKLSRPRDPTQDSNTRNKRLSRQNVVASSSCCVRLTPEKTIEDRLYQLEILVHKKHKDKCEQREVKAQCDVAEETSQTSFDVEVIGITRKKQVHETQEAESILKQPESSSPQACSNTLIPYEIKSHIEQLVSSQVEALKNEMNMKMEKKMKQMFDDRPKTDKAGVKTKGVISKYFLRKRKE